MSHLRHIIGLTGNIATGKSTVGKMLSNLGADVIDADTVAHQAMRAGTPVHAAIVRSFGPEILASGGEIDRQRLGALVFANPQALAQLEAIVHPATLRMVARQIERASADVVVVEAIKLIEAGMAEAYDSLWVTTCPPAQQIERLIKHRDITRSQAERRVQAQPPQEEKIVRADVVIDTSGALDETRKQVTIAWRKLIGRASR